MRLEKITNKPETTEKRRFHDACGMAHGLELLGERWALFIVRELMLGPRRFGDLRADLPGLSANVLTQRLHELEARGVLTRRKLPPPASVQVYALTEWGYEAEPIVQELGRWATRSPGHDPTLPISGVSILLSFRTMLDRALVGDFDAALGFRFGDDGYRGHLDAGGFTVAQGDPEGADLIFAGDPDALAAYVHGGVPYEALHAHGVLTIRGDMGKAARFRTFFPLPPKFVPPERGSTPAV
jgi:DNA-binding HxlR family transcriptional regulator